VHPDFSTGKKPVLARKAKFLARNHKTFWLISPWDGCQREQVRLLWSADELPAISDGGEHPVIGINVYMPRADDPRFAIGFQAQ
jgi:hypothetical protein